MQNVCMYVYFDWFCDDVECCEWEWVRFLNCFVEIEYVECWCFVMFFYDGLQQLVVSVVMFDDDMCCYGKVVSSGA